MKSPRVHIGVRIPQETFDQLHDEADARDVSVNWLCVRAFEDFLERLLPPGEFRLTDPHK